MGLPGIVEIERAALKGWPSLEVEWDGAWARRAANGHTQRANSIQCFDPADDGDVEARIAASRAWHAARGLKPLFRINPLSGPNLVAALDAGGWGAVDRSEVMAMELGEVAADPRGEVLAVDDPAFLEAQRRLKGYDEAALGRFRAILSAMAVPARGIVVRAGDGRVASSAVMSVADGIVITGNVVTDPAARRRGHAAAMMRTGLAWAWSAGAVAAALNVEAANAPAIALYEGLGYRRQYPYVYRTAPRP